MNKSNAMPHSVGAFLKGVGIADVKLDSNNHLLVYLDNGKILDAGQVPASDDALDATSERPVQNKIITAELDRIVNTLLADAVRDITTLQQTKVDKISGKGLSTKDFTSAHEAKLNSLHNYDDTTLRAELIALSNRLTALVGGNANEAINSFNEIIAFLNGVEDSDSLNGILAGIGTRIAAAEARITTVEVKQREIEGAIADYDAQIESLGGRVDAQHNEINLVKGNQQTAGVQISALQQRMNVAEDDIDSLEIKTATNAGSITSLNNRLSKAEALTRKVEDGSVVVDNTLSEVKADSPKPVNSTAVKNETKLLSSVWATQPKQLANSKMGGYIFAGYVESTVWVDKVSLYNLRKEGDTIKVAVQAFLHNENATEITATISLPVHEGVAWETITWDSNSGQMLFHLCYDANIPTSTTSTKFEMQDVRIIKNEFIDYESSAMSLRYGAKVVSTWLKAVYRKREFDSISISRYRNDSSGLYIQVTVDGANESKWVTGGASVKEVVTIDLNSVILTIDAGKWAGDQYINIPLIVSRIPYSPVILEDKIDKLSKNINNDLRSESHTLPVGTVVNTTYGAEGAVYTIPLPSYDIAHLSVKYKINGELPKASYQSLLQMNSDKVQVSKLGNYERGGLLYTMMSIGVNWISYRLDEAKEHTYNGDVAFAVRYTGEQSKAQIIISGTTLSITEGSATIGSVELTPTKSIDTLVSELKALSNIEVIARYAVGKSCADLLLGDLTIDMVKTIAKDDNSGAIVDSPYIAFVYAYDTDEHTIEMVVDRTLDTPTCYVAFDGILVSENATKTITNQLILGNKDLPITFYDLHIGFDSYEDAEIVEYSIYGSTKKQLISNINPRLTIWEGHGVDDCLDGDAPISNDMAASTDRLLRIFAEARERGYTPITWQDVLAWKLNNKPIPKRSYCIMMDDFYVDNFVKYGNRIPFLKYNVKAGLAIVEQFNREDSIEIDGATYTKGECIDMCRRAGWYLASHAKHTRLGSYPPSQLPSLLKDYSQEGIVKGLNSEIIVYPYGSYSNTLVPLKLSAFSLGVMTDIVQYNSRGANNFYLGRHSIGVTHPIDEVLGFLI